MSEVEKILTDMESCIKAAGYNCECQQGGVDAVSIDYDWLMHQVKQLSALIKGENK